MYNRKKLDHERLELILVQILMKIRLIILVLGILIFLYALAIMLNSLIAGILIGVLGLLLSLLGTSFWMITKTAQFLTWIALVGKKE
ncbi:MAG: hypothetical protein Q7U53_19390 [Anaerolineaceae bacterium]|nr:hypothetical protein [Anaerolineaceae bacterium]